MCYRFSFRLIANIGLSLCLVLTAPGWVQADPSIFIHFQNVETYVNLTPSNRQKMIQNYLDSPLTEEAVIAVSFIGSTELKAKYQEIWAKKAAYSRASVIDNPVLSASILPSGQTSKVDVSLEQDLIKWLVVPLQNRAVEAQFESDKLQFSEAILDHVAHTKKALLGFYAAQHILETQSQFTDAAEASFELSKRQYDAGNINELQLKTNEVSYQEALSQKQRSLLELQILQRHLQTMMGLDPEQTSWTVSGSLTEALPKIPSVNQLESLLDSQRPDLAALQARLDAEKSRLSAQTWQDQWGNVKAGIQYEREFDGQQALGPKIEFGIPLFNQGQLANQERDATIRQLSALLEAHKRQARYSIRDRLDQLAYYSFEIDRSKNQLIRLHERVTELTQKHYNYMLLGVFSLLQAKQAELRAREEYWHNLEGFWMAWTDLEKEVGGKIVQKGEVR